MSEKPKSKPQTIIEAHVMIFPQGDGRSYVEVRTGSHGPHYKITEDDIDAAVWELKAALERYRNPPPVQVPAAVEQPADTGEVA